MSGCPATMSGRKFDNQCLSPSTYMSAFGLMNFILFHFTFSSTLQRWSASGFFLYVPTATGKSAGISIFADYNRRSRSGASNSWRNCKKRSSSGARAWVVSSPPHPPTHPTPLIYVYILIYFLCAPKHAFIGYSSCALSVPCWQNNPGGAWSQFWAIPRKIL